MSAQGVCRRVSDSHSVKNGIGSLRQCPFRRLQIIFVNLVFTRLDVDHNEIPLVARFDVAANLLRDLATHDNVRNRKAPAWPKRAKGFS